MLRSPARASTLLAVWPCNADDADPEAWLVPQTIAFRDAG